MARNIEIKARAHQFDQLLASSAALASEPPMIYRQQDFFYDVPNGRLKLRQFDDNTPAELIFYQRDDRDGPKVSYYSRSPVTNPEATHALLAQALNTRGIVNKVLHAPITTLKSAAKEAEATTMIDMIRRVFNLNEKKGDEDR